MLRVYLLRHPTNADRRSKKLITVRGYARSLLMGVPSLFRWLVTKYPKLTIPVHEGFCEETCSGPDWRGPNTNNIELDNLYLDMNGILHPCSHPENKDAPATEEAMMIEVFKYIDRILTMVRPRKLLYLAVDGVAPRAKMNQQRSRRFRAAKEAAGNVVTSVDDEDGSDEEDEDVVFDSNCITPGTPFMQLVSKSLTYYVMDRMSNSAAWQDLKVIISDSSVPGEGEHKIMDFIRHQRLDPCYDPNLKHVIYGLDADLIMLSLATHEAHVKVLREDVFSQDEAFKKKGIVVACDRCGIVGHPLEACPLMNETVQPDC